MQYQISPELRALDSKIPATVEVTATGANTAEVVPELEKALDRMHYAFEAARGEPRVAMMAASRALAAAIRAERRLMTAALRA